MADEIAIRGLLELREGPSQGNPPAGVLWIYGFPLGKIFMKDSFGVETQIGGSGLHVKESHVMLALSETEVAVP